MKSMRKMRLGSDDWAKFGQVKALVANGMPVARACRETGLSRWKFYRMLKVTA